MNSQNEEWPIWMEDHKDMAMLACEHKIWRPCYIENYTDKAFEWPVWKYGHNVEFKPKIIPNKNKER